MILNLGSGKRPIDGAMNLDFNPDNPGVTHSWDIEAGLAFPDNTFDEVIAFHIIEHIHNLSKLLSEIHRVCKHGARIKIEAPHCTNPTFYDDPTHVRPLTENTIPFICDIKNDGVLKINGRFKLIKSGVIGEPWSRVRPTCVIAEMEVDKGGT